MLEEAEVEAEATMTEARMAKEAEETPGMEVVATEKAAKTIKKSTGTLPILEKQTEDNGLKMAGM